MGKSDIISAAGIYLAAMSLMTFLAYGIDKYKARAGVWRISERTLIGMGLIGGALGGLLGMKVWHHKTKHKYFWAINITAFTLHIALMGFLLSKV